MIVTEDGATNAPRTIEALFRAMCRVLIPEFDNRQLGRECFEPPEDRLREAISGNKWKSRRPRDQALNIFLIESIAGHLVRPNAFVLFHFDGDMVHSMRHQCENEQFFEEHVRARVMQKLRTPQNRPVAESQPKRALSDEQVDEAMRRLVPLTPFYCIEAWTYYNTGLLRTICPPTEHSVLDEWDRAPGATEELVQPNKHISVNKAHNRDLAERGFPARRAFNAGKSFANTVEMLRANVELMKMLTPLVYSSSH